MTSIKPRVRPYTNPMIKNPTYPTVIGNQIRELPWRVEGNQMEEDSTVIGFLVEPDDWDKLQLIKSQLHGGTDRERDFGHRLWLILEKGQHILQKDLK